VAFVDLEGFGDGPKTMIMVFTDLAASVGFHHEKPEILLAGCQPATEHWQHTFSEIRAALL